ncbi:MAG: alpha/beta hydrolase, partial [bacterium]|nr:alpha/beta hydrolase [bacterium]
MIDRIRGEDSTKRNDHIPQTEAEWFETGKFKLKRVLIGGKHIECAVAEGVPGSPLVLMAGGIPRESDRQKNLPLINKLFGLIASQLKEEDVTSVQYHQPGTGRSGGKPSEETLETRTNALIGLVKEFQRETRAEHINLVGSSSGAYMAIRAARKLQEEGVSVRKLALLSPAAYPRESEVIPYGEVFRNIISQNWDVKTAQVFSDLRAF